MRVGSLAVDKNTHTDNVYPGNRSLAYYEGGQIDKAKNTIYAFESLVFSLVLLFQLGSRI